MVDQTNKVIKKLIWTHVVRLVGLVHVQINFYVADRCFLVVFAVLVFEKKVLMNHIVWRFIQMQL